MSYTSINKIGTLQTEGLLGLSFYKDDINILEKRLLEVASKNTGFETSQGVEHFQNQFIVQRNNIAELRHKINKHVQKMSRDILMHGGHIDKQLIENDDLLITEYKRLEMLIKELRHEFNVFLSKWM